MALFARMLSMLILVLLTMPVIFLKGCGDIDTEEGCPPVVTLYSGCANFANPTDTFTGPSTRTLTIGPVFGGGSVHYTPLEYVIADSAGVPRNKVCVELHTDGYFYQDKNHTIVIPSSYIYLRTNERGVICVYWSTEDLPGSPGVGQAAHTGDSFIDAQTGQKSHSFQVNWTVSPQT